MGFINNLRSTLTVKIISANPLGFLSVLQLQNIPLMHVQYIDDLTLKLRFKRRYRSKISAIAQKQGIEMTILSETGFQPLFNRIWKRPVLIVGFLVLLAASFYLPTRVLFIRVEGNKTVPTNKIVHTLSQMGLSFGASRKDIRSEKIKNALLHAVPELEWAGVNTAGCVATVSVRERQFKEDPRTAHSVTSIVAARDGVITEMIVTSGNPICKVGQGVLAGQVLISGYTDCGISIKAGISAGEVYASTVRDINALLPHPTVIYGAEMEKTEKYSLIFGKKRINFFRDSGILDGKCVKMVDTNYLTLPGGFVLPVALVRETYLFYEDCAEATPREAMTEALSRRAQDYIKSQMIAGKIHSTEESISKDEAAYHLTAQYTCIEMIGRQRNEEIIKP